MTRSANLMACLSDRKACKKTSKKFWNFKMSESLCVLLIYWSYPWLRVFVYKLKLGYQNSNAWKCLWVPNWNQNLNSESFWLICANKLRRVHHKTWSISHMSTFLFQLTLKCENIAYTEFDFKCQVYPSSEFLWVWERNFLHEIILTDKISEWLYFHKC